MDHLREEGRDVPGDLAPQRLGGASPDAFGPDEHAATSLSSARAISSRIASTESLLSPASGGRGTRLVAASGSFSSARPRWATRAWPTAPLARDPLTDTTGNRRPKSGCPGSVTSISAKSPSSGFWKGVPTDVLVRLDPARAADALRGPPGRGRDHPGRDQGVAHGTGRRARPAHDPVRHGGQGPASGSPAGLPDLAPAGEPLLPTLPARLGAFRTPGQARRPCRQLRRRLRHLLPAGERAGGPGDDAAADDTAGADGERSQDPADPIASGKLRLPRLHGRPVLRQGRGALYRHTPVPEGGPSPAATDPRSDHVAMAQHQPRGARGGHQPSAPRLDGVLQPRAGAPDLRPGAPVRRATGPTMVDAAERPARHRVPPIPGRAPVRGARPLPPATPPWGGFYAKCDGCGGEVRAARSGPPGAAGRPPWASGSRGSAAACR